MNLAPRSVVVLACIVAFTALPLTARAADGKETKTGQWPVGKSYSIKGATVHLSAPVLVARKPMPLDKNQATDRDLSGSYLWYPQIAKHSNGELVAIIRLAADNLEVDADAPIGFCWSKDGGLTWSDVEARNKGQGYVNLMDHDGNLLHLPYILYNDGKGGLRGPLNVISKGSRKVEFVADGVEITGLTGKPVVAFVPPEDIAAAAKTNQSGFYFDGQVAMLRDGKTFLTALYGVYEGDKRSRLLCAESTDGRKWIIRSTVVDSSVNLGGTWWSNSENAICRLADGRLMCIFREDTVTYGQCFSDDDGKTWSQPVAMGLPGHAEPGTIVMADGTVVLTGGRPENYLWFNNDGTGKGWQEINTFRHHDQLVPSGENFDPAKRVGGTSSYTEIIAVGPNELLCIYDCYTKDNHFGIYIQRATIDKTAN